MEQLSLFDYMDADNNIDIQSVNDEAPVLLLPGDHVFLVVKGDVEEHIVLERTWDIGKRNRGYDLDHNLTWNDRIGVDCFKNRKDADNLAEQNLRDMDCIRKEDIRPVKTVAYRYEYYDREILYFYCILEDGNIYMKSSGQFIHISGNDDIDLEQFERTRDAAMRDHADSYQELTDYQPVFENMYRCKHDLWLYAEARYNHH